MQFAKSVEFFEWEKINEEAKDVKFIWIKAMKDFFTFDISSHFHDSLSIMKRLRGNNYMFNHDGSVMSVEDSQSKDVFSPLLPSMRD